MGGLSPPVAAKYVKALFQRRSDTKQNVVRRVLIRTLHYGELRSFTEGRNMMLGHDVFVASARLASPTRTLAHVDLSFFGFLRLFSA